jgi:hypothetical protein
MPRLLVAILVAALVLGRPCPSSATDAAEEAGLGIGAATLTLVYLPAKIRLATVGCAVGAFTGFVTGGDVRAAYSIWVPTASGSYFVRPAHLQGTEPFEFFGSDYADRPSSVHATEEFVFYEAMYESK